MYFWPVISELWWQFLLCLLVRWDNTILCGILDFVLMFQHTTWTGTDHHTQLSETDILTYWHSHTTLDRTQYLLLHFADKACIKIYTFNTYSSLFHIWSITVLIMTHSSLNETNNREYTGLFQVFSGSLLLTSFIVLVKLAWTLKQARSNLICEFRPHVSTSTSSPCGD